MSFLWNVLASWIANQLSNFKGRFSGEKLHLSLSMKRWYDSYWDLGSAHGEPAMFINSKWYATNDTKKPIYITGAYLDKPKAETSELETLLTQHPESDEFGEYPILPKSISEVMVIFTIQPPCRKEGESLNSKIVFVDNFNRKHKAKAQLVGMSRDGKLIFCMKLDEHARGELGKNQLPSKVLKKLAKEGHGLSHSYEVIPSRSGEEWEIKDTDSPRLIYTAKLRDTELSLFKQPAPPPRKAPSIFPSN